MGILNDLLLGGQSSKPPVFSIVASDQTRTLQTLANVTGLSCALEIGTYHFEAILSVASSSTAGNQYALAFTGTASIEGTLGGTLAAATSRWERLSAFGVASTAMIVLNGNGIIHIRGIIAITVAGTLTVQHLKVTSGTATVRTRSSLICRKLI